MLNRSNRKQTRIRKSNFFLFSLLVAFFTPSAFSSEMVAEIAKQVTVRIEGATQGSGVVVEKNGDEYTVLTAWHVLKSIAMGEEVDVFTSDGAMHRADISSKNKIKNVDLGTIDFISTKEYLIPSVGNADGSSYGSKVFVAGFPLSTSAVPNRIFRFLIGDVIANATIFIPDGYQLIYSNPTLPGMSGGPLLNVDGELVGVHGRAETDMKMTENSNVAVKTGNNMAIPISYWSEPNQIKIEEPNAKIKSLDNYLALSEVGWQKGDWEGVIENATLANRIKPTHQANFYLTFAYHWKNDYARANRYLYSSLRLPTVSARDYHQRGRVKFANSSFDGALSDYEKAYGLESDNIEYLYSYASSLSLRGDNEKAISLYLKMLGMALSHNNADAISRACVGILGSEKRHKGPKSSQLIADIKHYMRFVSDGICPPLITQNIE